MEYRLRSRLDSEAKPLNPINGTRRGSRVDDLERDAGGLIRIPRTGLIPTSEPSKTMAVRNGRRRPWADWVVWRFRRSGTDGPGRRSQRPLEPPFELRADLQGIAKSSAFLIASQVGR